jgi:hypothetical protein
MAHKPKEDQSKPPTFSEFVDEAFADIFDGLITGGTSKMKSRVWMCIERAVIISKNGGFSPSAI